MKKSLLLVSLGLVVIGSVFALNNVEKVSDIEDKQTGGTVSYTEFNVLVNTLRGLHNTLITGDENPAIINKLGINVPNEDNNVSLKVANFLRLKPNDESPGCNDDYKGTLVVKADKKLYGCNGSSWVPLNCN